MALPLPEVELTAGSVVAGAVVTFLIDNWIDRRGQAREKERAREANYYSWEQACQAADLIGAKLLRKFHPDYILTFSGASGIFSNLALERTVGSTQLTNTRILTGQFLNREANPEVLLAPGMMEIPTNPTDRWRVLIPSSLETRPRGRIAIIDDSTITGGSFAALKRHLIQKLGYKPDDVKTGCFVCYEGVKHRRDNPVDIAAFFTAKTEIMMPWGKAPW